MKTLVPENLKLTDRTYNNLRKHGAIPEFVDYELPNMITYFTETEDKKKSWQMTVQRWMRSAFHGKAGRDWEYNRHNKRIDIDHGPCSYRRTPRTKGQETITTTTQMSSSKRKVMPAPKPGKISRIKIREAIAMTRNKRLEFADYLNNNCK